MKTIYILGLMFFVSKMSFCQTISINGTVKNQQGQPVPLAFVRDAQHYYATYADSAGNFILKADPASVLQIFAVNYNDAQVKIENKATLDVVLVKGASSSGGNLSSAGSSNNNDGGLGFGMSQQVAFQSGYSQGAREGFVQEPTKGSIYLFANWVHGFAISKGDSLLYDMNNLYNYDKLTGNLLFTRDKNVIMQVNKQRVKTFSLYNGMLYPHVFENAAGINNRAFTEVLLSTPKYKVYKQTDAKLLRADFHTDGVIESGHKYDEYKDVERYYFVKLPDGQPQSFSLKKSALKKLFAGDADKYMDAHSDKDIDDEYLRGLGYSLNQ